MNKLEVTNWKEFQIKDIFNIETGKDLIYCELNSGEYYVIGHGRTDLGLTAKTEYLETHKLYDNKTTITLADRGNFYASCHNKPFYIGTRVKALTYKYDITIDALNFICTIINKEQYRHCYGRNCTDKLPFLKVKLPSKNNLPDIEFMSNYIKNLGLCSIKTSNSKNRSIDFNVEEWHEFKLADLFDMTRGSRLTVEDREKGHYPFVTAGFSNLGVTEFIDNESQTTYDNAITIDMFGNCFYHETEFKCDDNILVLTNTKLNKFTGLFLSCIISVDKYKCSYGRQYRQKDFNQHVIKLPTKDNNPDWQFMEDYIKSLQFADRI